MKVQAQIDELLTLRASEWFEIMKNPSPADKAAFIAWLGESRRHVQEFLDVAAVDEAVNDIPVSLREDLDELVARVRMPVATLPARARPQPWSRLPWRWTRHSTVWTAAAALIVAAGLWLSWRAASTELATGIGEQRTVALADGSIITLNTGSRIRLQYKNNRRDIELKQGEAFFKVAADAQRPFRVNTSAGTVEVLGTQFNVYARHDGVTRVSVLDGSVRLATEVHTLTLQAGEEADLHAGGAIERRPGAAVEQTTAWRYRRLIFSDAPLEEIAHEFNRYNRAPRIRLVNVARETYRFAGIFDADDPHSLADLLSRESDLLVQRGEREIIIQSP